MAWECRKKGHWKANHEDGGQREDLGKCGWMMLNQTQGIWV